MSMTDEQSLIARVAAGENGAFDRLIEPYRAELLRFAQRQLREDRDRAEDVLQEAWLNAFRSIQAGARPEHPRAWLFAIVRNGVVNSRRATRPTHSLEDRDQRATDAEPAVAVEQREWLDWLMGAIGELPLRQREALLGHAFEGRSHADIAARLETTVSAVKTLLHRARRALAAAGSSPLTVLLPRVRAILERGQLAGRLGAQGAAGVLVKSLTAAAVVTGVLMAGHGAGLGSVLADPSRAGDRTGGTPASHGRHSPDGGPISASAPTRRRIGREGRRALFQCTRGKGLLRGYTPAGLRYAAHHLSEDEREYTDCEQRFWRAALEHPRRHRHR